VAELPDRPDSGLLELDDHAPLPGQVGSEGFIQLEDRFDAAVVLVVEGLPFGPGAAPENLGDPLPAVAARTLELNLDQVRVAGAFAESPPELRFKGAAGNPAVP